MAAEKILWMTEFLNTETHTPVLLMNYLLSQRLREVRIWVNTVFIITSPQTEIGRSARGQKITGAPCKERIGDAVPRAENFGALITADHKVLSDNCESRNNHRYAVVMQDVATQWIQAYPCKTHNFTRNPEKLAKVPGARDWKPKVIYTDNSLEFGKASEDLSWNHCTSDTTQMRNKRDC